MNLYNTCYTIKNTRDKISNLESQIKELRAIIEVEKDFFKAHCLNEGIYAVQFRDLGTFSLRKDSYPSIKDSDIFFKFLDNEGESDLAKKTIDKTALKAWWGGLERKPEPEDIGLSIFKKTDISIRKK